MILAIFALGIPVASALLVRSANAHQRLRALAITTIRHELGLRASLGRVQIELVPFGVVARDVVLDDPIYGRLADAATIRIAPSVGSLLHGRVEIASIELDRASVHLVVREDGIRNLPALEAGGDGPPTLPFRRLVVRRATLSVDAEPEASAELVGVDVEVRGEEGHVIAVALEATGGEVVRAGRVHALSPLSADVRVSPDHVEVAHAALGADSLAIELDDASIPLPPPSTIDELRAVTGRVRARYDAAELASLELPFELPRVSGLLALDVTLTPRDGEAFASGTVDLTAGRVEQFGLGERVHLALEATPSQVRITEGVVDLERGGGHVRLEASLGLGPDLPLTAIARPDGLSFGALMAQFEVSDNSLVEWIFDGEMHLAGSLADLDRLHIAGPIDLRTRDFVVAKDGYLARPVREVISISRGHFTGRWSFRPDGLRFEDLVADLPNSRIFGDVLLGFHNELRVEARTAANLADVSPLDGFPLAGVGEATCHIVGTFQDPSVTGHVQLAGFEFNDFRLGDVDSDAIIDRDGQGVTFPRMTLVKTDSRYTAEGLYLDFHGGRFAMRGRLGFERMAIADFYHIFHFEADERFLPFQGVVRGSAPFSYTNGYPGDSPTGTLGADLDLEIQTATLNGYAFEDGLLRGRFDWYDWSRSYRGAVLQIEHAELRKGDALVTMVGTMQREGVLAMTVSADRVALRDVEGVGDRFPSLDGIAGVVAQVSGSADRMIVDADVGLYDVAYAGQFLGDGRTYVRMTWDDDPWVRAASSFGSGTIPEGERCPLARRGLANANWPEDPPIHTTDGPMRPLERPSAFLICGSFLDGAVGIDLAVGRQSSFPLRGKIRVDDLDVTRFLPSVRDELVTEAETTGRVSAVLRFDDGGMLDPASLRGNVRVTGLSVSRGGLHVENARPILVQFDRGAARIVDAELRGPGLRLRVDGDASLDAGLGLAVVASLDLSDLPSATPMVREATGMAELRLSVTGAFADPEYYGEARLEHASLRLASLAEPITDLSGHATFSARRVLVESISARLAGGQVHVDGEAVLGQRSIDHYAFRVRARGLSFTPADGLEVSLGADAELGWTRGERLPRLGGEVRVSRLEYTRNIELGATIGELSRTQRTAVDRYDPERDWLALDLRIRQDRPFVLRNNLIDAEVRIEDSERPFRLTGTNQRFGAVGDLRFARGRVFFRNTSFDLRAGGALTFDDPTRLSARFDVHASTDLRRSGDLSSQSWRILLDATGTLDSFSITTRSDPDLPQEDILLLLAVGMTRSELEALQGGDITSTLALEALASVTGIDREVRRAVPVIDDFRLSSAYSVRTGRTEPQVSIGKRIADRVRLSATTGLSEAREFRAVLEAQLSDTTSIQAGYDNYNLTSASSFGNVGVDLRWRLEFQ